MDQKSAKKPKEEIINYVGMKCLCLETADYRLFRQPYGPAYPEAVGQIFRWSSTSIGDAADKDTAYVKNASINIFGKGIGGEKTGETVPIKVYHQLVHDDGLVLLARIEDNRSKCLYDHKLDGTWLILILYPESVSKITISQ